MRHWLLPHPLLTPLLTLIWILLVNRLSPGSLLLGLLLGWVIPLFTRRFWPDQVRVRKPLTLLRFRCRACSMTSWSPMSPSPGSSCVDPGNCIRRSWRCPLRLRSELGISLLANTICLTPGTVSAWLSPDRRTLVVHGLDVRRPGRRWSRRSSAATRRHCWRSSSHAELAITVAFALVGAALVLTLWRLLRGPDQPDRILALDTLVRERHRPAGPARHPSGLGPLFRGRAPDRHDGLRRHRRALQIPAARRHHRIGSGMLDILALHPDPHRRALHLHRLARAGTPAGLLHPPAWPDQGHHARRRQPADRLHDPLQHPGQWGQLPRDPGHAVSLHHRAR